MQNDILAIKLKKLVSIIDFTKEFTPNREGNMIRETLNTKIVFP